MIRRLHTLILVLITTNLFSQKNEHNIDSILQEIRMSNRCELSNSIGYAGSPSLQNERMSKLAAFGDSTSLVNKLITENNPVASFYLWRALQSKSIPIPENLMKKLQEDRRKVSVINGCIKRTETLSHIIGLSL